MDAKTTEQTPPLRAGYNSLVPDTESHISHLSDGAELTAGTEKSGLRLWQYVRRLLGH